MRLPQIFIIGTILSASPCAAAGDPTPGENEENDKFASWFQSHGGTLDDRVTIGYEPKTKLRGLIATSTIPADTLLIHTPGALVLKNDADHHSEQCLQIEEIVKEMNIGEESKWHDYFQFEDSAESHLPGHWNQAWIERELQGIPPTGDTHRHVDWYQEACLLGREMSDLDWKALTLYLTRAVDVGLVPMYDLMNHHNGRINTYHKNDGEGGISVYALTDIEANTAIYNSYALSGVESTIDIFNTYGFVEEYPQLWRWNDDKLEQLNEEDETHAYQRYRDDSEPNNPYYEVLVVSPKLAALFPTKELVQPLGHEKISAEGWQERIHSHHAHLKSSFANLMGTSAKAVLNELLTTIKEDEFQIQDEIRRFKGSKNVGRMGVDGLDSIKLLEFRLAFKRALKLTSDIALKDTFFVDEKEESCMGDTVV